MARTVLVVDDEPLILYATASMLEDYGCEVMTARSGSEALELLTRNKRIEVLITDVDMPHMSGYDLAKRAKRAHKELQVVVMSGQDQASENRGFPFVHKLCLARDLVQTIGGC